MLGMQTESPVSPEKKRSRMSRGVVSTLLTLEIIANMYIVWYLLYKIPSNCAEIAISSNGTALCGLEPGGYVAAGISFLLIVTGIFGLYWWNCTVHR